MGVAVGACSAVGAVTEVRCHKASVSSKAMPCGGAGAGLSVEASVRESSSTGGMSGV